MISNEEYIVIGSNSMEIDVWNAKNSRHVSKFLIPKPYKYMLSSPFY